MNIGDNFLGCRAAVARSMIHENLSLMNQPTAGKEELETELTNPNQ
jgi:hypothetical protein